MCLGGSQMEKNISLQRDVDKLENLIMTLDFKFAGNDKYRDLIDDMYVIQQKLTKLKQTMSIDVIEIE